MRREITQPVVIGFAAVVGDGDEAHDGARAPRLVRGADERVEAVEQMTTPGEAGDGVSQGAVLDGDGERREGVDLPAQVAHEIGPSGAFTFGGGDIAQDEQPAAGLAPGGERGDDDLDVAAGLGQVVLTALVEHLRAEPVQGGAHGAPAQRRPPEQEPGRLVGVDDQAGAVDDQDGVGERLDDTSTQPGALTRAAEVTVGEHPPAEDHGGGDVPEYRVVEGVGGARPAGDHDGDGAEHTGDDQTSGEQDGAELTTAGRAAVGDAVGDDERRTGEQREVDPAEDPEQRARVPAQHAVGVDVRGAQQPRPGGGQGDDGHTGQHVADGDDPQPRQARLEEPDDEVEEGQGRHPGGDEPGREREHPQARCRGDVLEQDEQRPPRAGGQHGSEAHGDRRAAAFAPHDERRGRRHEEGEQVHAVDGETHLVHGHLRRT